MKNVFPNLLLASVLFASCQNSETRTASNTDSTNTSASISTNNSDQCFQYIQNKDTATLKIKDTNNSISGDLSYNFYEKDKNNGTISGIVKGDTIIADYTFNSEGSKSVREVVWLKKDGKLLEGFGDVEEIDGKMKFKNIDKLSFKDALEFKAVDCR